ncbi:MAG: MCE family protein [Rhodococcus sp. (in: high G+C Gram-positive bacteria)]|uniref:MCE family protein n=1 Tax=Rhodococcus sp. TaxID=1831 RepID=UPI003BB1A89A
MSAPLALSRGALALRGAGLIVVVVLLSLLSVGFYSDFFTSTAKVTLLTDRAGLLMDEGSDVKVNGVVVGSVSKVSYTGDKAELELSMKPDELATIPAGVSAELEPTTLFGRKFVTLVAPESAGSGMLAAGSVIDASRTTIEVNDVFSTLTTVLDSLEPSKVNSTLTAAATALQGRGSKLGDVLSQVDTYLTRFNGSTDVLQRDITKLADNADTFADASPAFLQMVDNFSVTSDSIVEKDAQLSAFLLSFTGMGNAGTQFFEETGPPLIQALDVLDPTTKLFAEYSPEYTCFAAAMNQSRKLLENTLGATRPGLNVLSTVLFGDPPYAPGKNLPVNGADNPPNCYGAPMGPGDAKPAQTNFNDGSDAYQREFEFGELAKSPLFSLLFGPDNMFGPAK